MSVIAQHVGSSKATLCAADPRVVSYHFQSLLTSEVHDVRLLNVRISLSHRQIHALVNRAVDAFAREYGTA
jgi:hypothetical protein